MVGRMERQTASSSASCSPSSAAASSSSACGGKKRPDILNMIRVRLNLLTSLAPVLRSSPLVWINKYSFILFSRVVLCLRRPDVDPAKENLVNRSVRVTLLCIKKSSRKNRLGALQTTHHGSFWCKGDHHDWKKKDIILMVYSFYQ